MTLSAVSGATTSVLASAQPPVQSASLHKHGRHHAQSIADVDAQSSSVASAPNTTGKVGSKVDITV